MRASLIFVLALALVAAGCNTQDRSDLARDASQLGKTAQRAATNATVAGKVEAALALRKGVDTKALHVEATGPVVTISGTVESDAKRKLILDIAQNTVGVDSVVDKMTISGSAGSEQAKRPK